jgi:hypothetical protein
MATGRQFAVPWQVVQSSPLLGWVVDRPLARTPSWQATQVVGVPVNLPSLWQLSHAVVACAPVRAKPVAAWSKFEKSGSALLSVADCPKDGLPATNANARMTQAKNPANRFAADRLGLYRVISRRDICISDLDSEAACERPNVITLG